MGMCGPTKDQRSWTFDLDPGGVDPVVGHERLQQAYLRSTRTIRWHHRAGVGRSGVPRARQFNGQELSAMPMLWAYARDLFRTPSPVGASLETANMTTPRNPTKAMTASSQPPRGR